MGAEHGQEAIESAALFLFETFHNKDHVGPEEIRAIKQMFGPFPSSRAEASCASVARLVGSLGDSRVQDFIQTQTSHLSLQQRASFGCSIAFSYDCYALEPLEELPPRTHEEQGSLDFISFLSSQQSGSKTTNEDEESSSGRSLNSGDGSILRMEVEKYLNRGNMISSSPEELCTSLFEMLASQRSDDELQNEVSVLETHCLCTETWGRASLIRTYVHSS